MVNDFLENLNRNGSVNEEHTLVLPLCPLNYMYVCIFYCLLLWNCECLFELWTLIFAATVWTFVNELQWIYATYLTRKSSMFVFSTVREPVSSAIRVYKLHSITKWHAHTSSSELMIVWLTGSIMVTKASCAMPTPNGMLQTIQVLPLLNFPAYQGHAKSFWGFCMQQLMVPLPQPGFLLISYWRDNHILCIISWN